MRFAEALAEVTTETGRPCKVGGIVAGLDDDDRNQWDQAVAVGVPGSKLQDALVRTGHRVSKSGVTDHLAGRCCCG